MNAATMSTRKSRPIPATTAVDELLTVLERAVALAFGRLEALGHPLLDRALPLAAAVRVSASSECGVAMT